MHARIHRIRGLAAWLVLMLAAGASILSAEPLSGSWSQLIPSGTLPGARSWSPGVYDPVRERLVIYGGYGYSGGWLGDTWALSMTGAPVWSRLPDGPGPRADHTAVYDVPRDRMIVFGGTDGDLFSCCNEPYGLALPAPEAWTQVAPLPSSYYPRRHTAIYDPIRERMVVFGGFSTFGGNVNAVWELSLSGTPSWTQLLPSGTPPSPRSGSSAIYDPIGDRMLVFGGSDGVLRNDVWALNLSGPPAWSLVTPSGTPPVGRTVHVAIHDPLRDRMVVFAGYGPAGYLDDVWELSLAGAPEWAQLSPSGPGPIRRAAHVGVYDSASDRMLVFGGQSDIGAIIFNDTWALSWAPAVAVPTVPPAFGVRMAPPRPTPAGDLVVFDFEIPASGLVELAVFDLSGRRVKSVVEHPLPEGRHSARWDRRTDGGARAPAGVYFARLRFGPERLTRRLLLLD